jgi:hypothetical protein
LEPQVLPEHWGSQQVPLEVHAWPPLHEQSPAQLAQFSPVWQLPLPHTRSSTQLPFVHVEPLAQLPHTPPQPSEPQLLPVQLLVQHCPETQLPLAQAQSVQFAQVSPAAMSQVLLPQVEDATQVPPWQMLPVAHCEHTPPQPSSPHLPVGQLGVQHVPPTHTPPLQPQSNAQLSQLSVGSQTLLPQET